MKSVTSTGSRRGDPGDAARGRAPRGSRCTAAPAGRAQPATPRAAARSVPAEHASTSRAAATTPDQPQRAVAETPRSRSSTSVPSSWRQRSHEKLVSSPLTKRRRLRHALVSEARSRTGRRSTAGRGRRPSAAASRATASPRCACDGAGGACRRADGVGSPWLLGGSRGAGGRCRPPRDALSADFTFWYALRYATLFGRCCSSHTCGGLSAVSSGSRWNFLTNFGSALASTWRHRGAAGVERVDEELHRRRRVRGVEVLVCQILVLWARPRSRTSRSRRACPPLAACTRPARPSSPCS